MELESYNAYHSHLEAMKHLNDTEVGRLYRALLTYSSTGVEPELRGNERYVFPQLKWQIDRDKEAYRNKCKSNAENGRKGGRPRKPNGFSETERLLEKPNGFLEKLNNNKYKNKDNNKDYILSSSYEEDNARNDDDDFVYIIRLWEKAAGRLASPLQGEELQALLEEHTAESVGNAIRSAAQHNAVNLAYIKAVLNGKPKQQASGEKEYSPEMQAWLRGERV